jgi:hypothetical protein
MGGMKRRETALGSKNLVPGAGLEPAHLAAGDFESPASTDFAIRAARFCFF